MLCGTFMDACGRLIWPKPRWAIPHCMLRLERIGYDPMVVNLASGVVRFVELILRALCFRLLLLVYYKCLFDCVRWRRVMV